MAGLWQGLPVLVSVDPHFVCLPTLFPSGQLARPVRPGRWFNRAGRRGAARRPFGYAADFEQIGGWFHSSAGGAQL